MPAEKSLEVVVGPEVGVGEVSAEEASANSVSEAARLVTVVHVLLESKLEKPAAFSLSSVAFLRAASSSGLHIG